MRIAYHHNNWVYRGLFLAVLALGGLFFGGVSAGAVEDKPWSLMGGYAVEEGALFDGTYNLSPAWQLNLSRLEERLQLRAVYLPTPNWSLQAGYDFTKEQYLAGLKYRGELGENTAFLAKATGYRRRDVNEYLLDYQCDLEIGVNLEHDHLVFAGIRGEYIPGKPHDPEIYIRLDLNWNFGRDWHLRLEPLVLVEGRIDHRTTLSRKWPNGTEAGIYCKNEEFRWDAGIFVKL
ncbi:MAG: hypothetical protein GX085_02845 [Firmicutes bacterium]|nr:hypothetical protein [Bacillota bacterium]